MSLQARAVLTSNSAFRNFLVGQASISTAVAITVGLSAIILRDAPGTDTTAASIFIGCSVALLAYAGLCWLISFIHGSNHLLRLSDFSPYWWITVAGAEGKVVGIRNGGEKLELQFVNGIREVYPIRALVQGSLIETCKATEAVAE